MAIVLVTGLPGHGKTVFSLVRWKEESERDGRQVFHNGIKGLNLDWPEFDPLKWYDLPATSIMVIDEAQKVFRLRARSSEVPKHVSELETHRHGGIDLVLITQHPTLVDPHVRKLIDRHFHVVRAFGTHNTTVYEFPTGAQDYPEKSRRKPGVLEHRWRYPKAAFEWYQSAEVHTVKRRIPMKVWLLLAVLLSTPVLFGLVWLRIHAMATGGGPGPAAAASSAGGLVRSTQAVPRPELPPPTTSVAAGLEAARYLAPFQPRVPGLAFTAPAYDEMTKPAEAPYPAVCGYSATFPCRCWSQRGFSLIVPEMLCKKLAREPMDPYWLRRGPNGLERQNEVASDGRSTGSSVSSAPAPAPSPAAMPLPGPAAVPQGAS